MTAITPSLLQHPFHQHALVLQELSESFSWECRICRFSVEGSPVYHCIDCEFFLHKSCAELPPRIQHPSHPQHPLVLSTSSRSFRCYGCRYALHAATLPPPEKEEHKDEQKHEDKDHHEEEMIEHFAHDHPLASFHVDAPNYIKCKACGQGISGCVYGCRACIFVLHEFCALAPREIMNHPLHPQHPLTLLADLECKIKCHVCKSLKPPATSAGKIYRVIFTVALAALSCSTNRAPNWPKRLCTLFIQTTLSYANQVIGIALSALIMIDFYRCVPCNYNLHFSCTPLPHSVRHELHFHPLVLHDRVVDDFYDEQYCDLCETPRHPDHGVYYCGECNCAAHINCVIPKLQEEPEKSRQREDLMLKQLDGQISSKEVEAEALKKKSEMVMKDLEELEKKKQEILSSRAQREAESDMP
ncbi:hypothetical protein CRG98_034998 [Punica granatum]|uniref:DC1 domain-containing protein n=1 Tax=Punica granatum TaxID=22663 RepID=A0A2I0ILM0_PUNGR|nr:hypothetical protein CRG98_034998 [Punica granatum]